MTTYETPFGTFEYRGVRGRRHARDYWLAGPPSPEESWERWVRFWWRELPIPGYGINLGVEPDRGLWYVVTGSFAKGDHPLVDGSSPGGLSGVERSEEAAMDLIATGIRRLRESLVGPLDEMLVYAGSTRPRNFGDPWWDRIS